MSTNPMGSSGGNYTPPPLDFSRYTGSPFPPSGSNFYPPNPTIYPTNPYPGSSIGAYPNVNFPAAPPLSFQSPYPSSSFTPSVPSGMPNYSQPPLSFNPNPPKGDLAVSTFRLHPQV